MRVPRSRWSITIRVLWWNGGEKPPYEPWDFAHGGPHFVEILYTQPKDGKHEVVLRDVDHSNVPLETGNSYRFIVQATAEGAMAETKSIDIQFGKGYQDIKIARASRLK